MERHTSVEVIGERYCDLCRFEYDRSRVAKYDAKTTRGPWANLCQEHFDSDGVGLGLGRGQKFVYISG